MKQDTKKRDKIWVIKNQQDFNDMKNLFLKKKINAKMLLKYEKENTTRSFDYLFKEEDVFLKDCLLNINTACIIYSCESMQKITDSRSGINIMYYNVMSSSIPEVHTKFIGKAGGFLFSLYSIYGYNSFSLKKLIEILRREYTDIEINKVEKITKQCIRHLLCDQILIIN
jgi:hypothetical protein